MTLKLAEESMHTVDVSATVITLQNTSVDEAADLGTPLPCGACTATVAVSLGSYGNWYVILDRSSEEKQQQAG